MNDWQAQAHGDYMRRQEEARRQSEAEDRARWNRHNDQMEKDRQRRDQEFLVAQTKQRADLAQQQADHDATMRRNWEDRNRWESSSSSSGSDGEGCGAVLAVIMLVGLVLMIIGAINS